MFQYEGGNWCHGYSEIGGRCKNLMSHGTSTLSTRGGKLNQLVTAFSIPISPSPALGSLGSRDVSPLSPRLRSEAKDLHYSHSVSSRVQKQQRPLAQGFLRQIIFWCPSGTRPSLCCFCRPTIYRSVCPRRVSTTEGV